MKIAIRKEPNGSIYIDKTVLQRFDEQTLMRPPYNFSFTEVEVEDFECVDFDYDEATGFKFSQEKYNARKLREQNYYKLKELENWFDNYFDKQLNQSIWQEDFEVSHDSYFDKDYSTIDELKAQATIVRNQIRELRKEREQYGTLL